MSTTMHISDLGIVVNATTRFRRLPPLFPAASAPSDLVDAAKEYLDLTSPPDGDHAAWAKVMAGFVEDLTDTGHAPSDGDKQRSCDEAHGHVLQVQHNGIIKCRDCNAEWRAQGD